jgi:hypothetical protein
VWVGLTVGVAVGAAVGVGVGVVKQLVLDVGVAVGATEVSQLPAAHVCDAWGLCPVIAVCIHPGNVLDAAPAHHTLVLLEASTCMC